MPGSHVTFTPSATATLKSASIGMPATLPATDGANPAVVLRNLGPGTVWIAAAAGAPGAVNLRNIPDALVLGAGQTMLLASHPGFGGGTQAVLQGEGQVLFMRGTLTDAWIFPAATAAVI